MRFNSQLKLGKNILDLEKIKQHPTRDGYGLELMEMGDKNLNVVALYADLVESRRLSFLGKGCNV